MTLPGTTEAQHRLAPGPRGGRACARPGGAGRAQAGSQANRQGGEILHAPGLTRVPAPFAETLRPRLGGRGVHMRFVPGLTRDPAPCAAPAGARPRLGGRGGAAQ